MCLQLFGEAFISGTLIRTLRILADNELEREPDECTTTQETIRCVGCFWEVVAVDEELCAALEREKIHACTISPPTTDLKILVEDEPILSETSPQMLRTDDVI